MNKFLANILKTQLAGLPLIDKMAGMVQTVEYEDTTYDETQTVPTKKVQKIPVSADVELSVGQILADLIPDSSKKGILYFEDNGVTSLGKQGEFNRYRSKLRLVSWLNTKALTNDSKTIVPALINHIISKLEVLNATNSGNFIRLAVIVDSMPRQDKNIFAQYSYDLYNTQYLMPPFDFFAIDLSIEFSMHPRCLDNMVLSNALSCE